MQKSSPRAGCSERGFLNFCCISPALQLTGFFAKFGFLKDTGGRAQIRKFANVLIFEFAGAVQIWRHTRFTVSSAIGPDQVPLRSICGCTNPVAEQEFQNLPQPQPAAAWEAFVAIHDFRHELKSVQRSRLPPNYSQRSFLSDDLTPRRVLTNPIESLHSSASIRLTPSVSVMSAHWALSSNDRGAAARWDLWSARLSKPYQPAPLTSPRYRVTALRK